jgi:hypothetical protein
MLFAEDCEIGTISIKLPRLSEQFRESNQKWFQDTTVEATENVTVYLLYFVMIAASLLISGILYFTGPLPH